MTDTFVTEDFVHTLLSNSGPCQPISEAIHTPNDTSFTPILHSHIQNLRFITPTTPKPVLIVVPTHVSHVQAAVISARKHNLQMKIRSGGHDYEGVSYVSSETRFFLLDMQKVRAIELDMVAETAWVQTGATLGELYYKIAQNSKTHGFPAGVCPTVGVGGHLSGGGYGNMMRKYGLSVDHIVDAQIVNVHGQLLDRKSMGEDLFWAIRGGGGASFGVVLAYKIKLVRIPETVTVFKVQRTREENANDVVFQWQEVAPNLDEDLFIRMVLDVVRTSQTGVKTLRASFVALFLGDSDRLVSVMEQSFPELGLRKTDCIETNWVQSIFFWADIPMGTSDQYLLRRKPEKLVHLKRKSDYLKNPISKKGLNLIFRKMVELEFPVLAFNPYGGRMAQISTNATPFPHRGNLAKIQYLANWDEPGSEAESYYLGLLRKLYLYMTPFVSKNPRGSYLNYRDLDLGTNDHDHSTTSYRMAMYYGFKYFKENFRRLVEVKSRVDPENFFRNEQSIPALPLENSGLEL
ncbi:Xanthine dehydrogenase C subunit [Parasponia andersonii]|uniref:Xanthine dehydrogenase C subunit n=1 Tax=Parasponia andersonii TaxID=3476 RepID=A0A2P5APK5_PARAD|nr:Xanthine dehydrogenase C subunit [Parasponia andersonii]